MDNGRETRSLTEVQNWKEQCRREDEGLSYHEYRLKLKSITEKAKSIYHEKLEESGHS